MLPLQVTDTRHPKMLQLDLPHTQLNGQLPANDKARAHSTRQAINTRLKLMRELASTLLSFFSYFTPAETGLALNIPGQSRYLKTAAQAPGPLP